MTMEQTSADVPLETPPVPAGTPENDIADQWDAASEGIVGLESFIGTIDTAEYKLASEHFGNAQSYGDSVLLVMEVGIDQAIDPADFPFPTARLVYSVGKAESWNILDAGAKVVNAKGQQMGNSKYQQFIKRVTKELKVSIQNRGLSPFDAAVWVGLKFHFKREDVPIADRLIKENRKKASAAGTDPDAVKTTSAITLPVQWMQDTVPPLI